MCIRDSTCYLIQKTSLATADARAFLARCLLNGTPALRGRAMRAYGKLHDPEIDRWLRPLCEQIVMGEVEAIDETRMRTTKEELAEPVMFRSALETLRDVGNAASIDIIRRARSRNPVA